MKIRRNCKVAARLRGRQYTAIAPRMLTMLLYVTLHLFTSCVVSSRFYLGLIENESEDSTLWLGLLGVSSNLGGGGETLGSILCGSDLIAPGEMALCTVNSLSFKVILVPPETFYINTVDSGSSNVSNSFLLGETEVTYQLWNEVRSWALANGYTFANPGIMGDGSGDNDQHPVTTINWRDAMVWMNALTEFYNFHNGTSLVPVYYADSNYTTPIRAATNSTTVSQSTAGSQDNPYVKAGFPGNTSMANNIADGFRLPTSEERELAARYVNDVNGDGDIQDPGEYYPGSYASGATADYNNAAATNAVSVNQSNSGSSTSPVKSKIPNRLGLYDMSGNVIEWSFNYLPSTPFRRSAGGSWQEDSAYQRVGDSSFDYPYIEDNEIGIRFARNL